MPCNARIIGTHEHESHFVFDILHNNTTDIQPERHSTDTHGTFAERLIAAGNQRMRAITMTTTAAILALLPLALLAALTLGAASWMFSHRMQ